MNIVIGAGAAGLGAFYKDNTLEIYEENDSYGGLCGGFTVAAADGRAFHFDRAVHLSFTNDPTVREVFDQTEHYRHVPSPHSWLYGMWVKHPVQNNLYPLPPEVKIEAVKGFIDRDTDLELDSFAAWLKAQYGDWMYDNIFKVYNQKYWCKELSELSTEWLGTRFYLPTIDEILYGSYTDKTPNTYYAKEMRYPLEGGYASFLRPVAIEAERLGKVHYNSELTEIDIENKTACFKNGKEVKYERLFSSMPLPEIVKRVKGIPDWLVDMSKDLEWTSVTLVSLGFDKVIPYEDLWFYIYDEDILAARAYLPSRKSPSNAPEGCSSIQFEVYRNCRDAAPESDEVIDNCVYALEKMGLAEKSDIIAQNVRMVRYGNIIFKKNTGSITSSIVDWLADNDVISMGRFGEWKYLWSDQSFISGCRAAQRTIRS